ncbi:hypothetical protein [Paenibacillus lignilyticus]|uniref:Uncharacterized protein n=1 Tax=Paenibacillus lignilyticus TaxID=1172615 RepID=A0ABS5CA75_9BACL|nr:hypothetical protein [Paenibacillus lignilyticus]MBP3962903.1 hypothetical protein [Paenibacillus lignilyticus]
MKKKKTIRDIIYVSHMHPNNCFYSYGIEFHEFMIGVFPKPENLILLQHQFSNAQWNPRTRFDYVTREELDELIEDDVYGYGDFCWVDLAKEEDLDALSNDQIAELLFFGHLARPLHQVPKARFAYYAHDDGWFNKLYVTDLHDYEMLLANVIAEKLRKLTGRKFEAIPKDIATALLESTRDGLFIDLSKAIKDAAEYKIPLTAVGHFTDMDKIYGLRDGITEYNAWLVYSEKAWKLVK